MDAVQQLNSKLGAINVNNILREILNTPKYETLVPDQIKDRLNESGLYSTGRPIVTYFANSPNVYANFTIMVKKVQGKPSKHVTLKDTGAFHNSFALNAGADSFVIDYDENKPDGKVSDNVDLTNVFNLSPQELKELRIVILPDFIKALKDAIT